MIFQVILFLYNFCIISVYCQIKKYLGVRQFYNSQKEVVISSVLTSFLATLIYFFAFLLFILNLIRLQVNCKKFLLLIYKLSYIIKLNLMKTISFKKEGLHG